MPIYTREPGSDWQKHDLGPLKIFGLDEKKLMEKFFGTYKPGDEFSIVGKFLDDGTATGSLFVNGIKVMEFAVKR